MILGLGVNHRQLAGFFKRKSVAFEVIDNWQKPTELQGKLEGFEVVFRTPGLPYNSPAIQQALAKGTKIYSQTKLFFDLCPAKIIGVTGTKGKGTTATLIYRILDAALRPSASGGRDQDSKVYLAGNIGKDPFEFLDELKPADLVVLELSSFQLQDLHKSPHVAVVLKITPEHLDHHQSLEEYIGAKKPIVKYQNEQDFAILNYDNEVTSNFAELTKAKIIWNSVDQEVKLGCFRRGEKVVLNWQNQDIEIIDTSEVKLLGRFNLENITAAIAASAAVGVADKELIRKAVSEFRGLPHRLEFVREVKGVKFYNDSFSTTPETAIAAISAFSSPLILIVGGSDKNADYADLARAIADSKIKALIPIGTTGPKVANFARKAGFAGRIIAVKPSSMETIVLEANSIAESGDVVLLSPASASFDMFKNYKHRGEMFKKFVTRL